MDMEKTLIVENAETTSDVLKVHDTAVAENKKFYVAISKSGKRFGIKGGAVVQLADEEFAENEKYVEPKIQEEKEEIKEEPVKETETPEMTDTNEKVESVELQEPSNEEIKEHNEKLAHYDELVTKNMELQDEIAKLNAQIEELTLKVATPIVTNEENYVVTLEDVVDFMKEKGIHSLSI